MRLFHSKWFRSVVLIALPLLCIVISLFSGRFFLSPAEVFSTLLHPVPGAAATTVVFQLRLPRSVAAAFVGILAYGESLTLSVCMGLGCILLCILILQGDSDPADCKDTHRRNGSCS